MEHSEKSLQRKRWFGLKSVVRAIFLFYPLNTFLIFIFKRFDRRWPALRRFPPTSPSVVYRLESGGEIFLKAPALCDVAKDIFWGRGKRCDPNDRLVMQVFEALIDDSEWFLDVGAYSGLFALVAARRKPEVCAMAFEILPETYKLLVDNLVMNDVVHIVEPRLLGASSAAGVVKMPIHLSGGILPSSLSLGSSFPNGVCIRTDTLDSLSVKVVGKKVTIKIDVEGFEIDVIRGATMMIAASRPNFICEVLRDAKETKEMTRILKGYGYRFFVFTDNGLVEHADISPRADGRDWLFTTSTDLVAKFIRAS